FNTAQFGIAVPADSFDIVINEILFNPVTDGYDFIELYNRSDKFIDLSSITLAEYDLADTTLIDEFTKVSPEGRLFLPGTYIVITEDIEQTVENYFVTNTGNFIQNDQTPNYPDDEGIVVIQNAALQVIDKIHYYDNWHFALLDDADGVSLERVNYEFETQDQNNWHSASEDVHYATPGYQNSVFGNVSAGSGNINLEYEVFSPDGDAWHDLLLIHYQTAAAGYVANFTVFDAQGRSVKQLTNNMTLSVEGFITWDGVNEDGMRSKTGIYILYAELFDLNGNTEKHKLKFTLVN
ncbi:MAG: lamin tail domain-containing protein, partial [Chitinophagales bacterium]|nr:lamin tail domain-containing protein [Chitinophagales bacterium]